MPECKSRDKAIAVCQGSSTALWMSPWPRGARWPIHCAVYPLKPPDVFGTVVRFSHRGRPTGRRSNGDGSVVASAEALPSLRAVRRTDRNACRGRYPRSISKYHASRPLLTFSIPPRSRSSTFLVPLLLPLPIVQRGRSSDSFSRLANEWHRIDPRPPSWFGVGAAAWVIPRAGRPP